MLGLGLVDGPPPVALRAGGVLILGRRSSLCHPSGKVAQPPRAGPEHVFVGLLCRPTYRWKPGSRLLLFRKCLGLRKRCSLWRNQGGRQYSCSLRCWPGFTCRMSYGTSDPPHRGALPVRSVCPPPLERLSHALRLQVFRVSSCSDFGALFLGFDFPFTSLDAARQASGRSAVCCCSLGGSGLSFSASAFFPWGCFDCGAPCHTVALCGDPPFSTLHLGP